MNREKQGHDTTSGSRQRIQHNAKTSCHDITNWVATELGHRVILSQHENWVAIANIDNSKKSCRNIITKLQQEVKISGNKPLSRQTFWVVIEIQIIEDSIAT